MKFNKVTLICVVIILFLTIFRFYDSNKRIKKIEQHTTTSIPKAIIEGHSFILELAKNPSEQQKGLSNRNSLPLDHGMLFIFDQPSYVGFWMKDMEFPIDIIFIHDNEIVSIVENTPPPISNDATLPIYKPEHPSDKVLEINAGLAKKYHIKKGDRVDIKL
jgi:uncharacterized membrane protein (UPF0127 family)